MRVSKRMLGIAFCLVTVCACSRNEIGYWTWATDVQTDKKVDTPEIRYAVSLLPTLFKGKAPESDEYQFNGKKIKVTSTRKEKCGFFQDHDGYLGVAEIGDGLKDNIYRLHVCLP